jgi:hemolysin III
MPQLHARIEATPFYLLIIGGVLYSAGAAVYGSRFPNPWPRIFGYHEVNHVIGLMGAVAHYIAIWQLLV